MIIDSINPDDPRDDRVAQAIEALAAGELLALPTETFYGFAVDATNREALARLNRLKEKPDNSPILLLVSGAAQVEQVAATVPPRFGALVKMFWPGPLTLVLPAADSVPREITGGRGTVAVRAPGMSLPRRLAKRLGRPISGVSANRHGEHPCRTALEVAEAFPRGIDRILDGGRTPGGAASTIVDLSETPPRLLRAGLLPAATIRAFVEDLAR